MANQITERGLLLRHLILDATIERFFKGDVEAWNPFVLTTPERLLFLYHLIGIDGVTVGLIDDLAALDTGSRGQLRKEKRALQQERDTLEAVS